MTWPHSVSRQPGRLQEKPGLDLTGSGYTVMWLRGWFISFIELDSGLHLAIYWP